MSESLCSLKVPWEIKRKMMREERDALLPASAYGNLAKAVREVGRGKIAAMGLVPGSRVLMAQSDVGCAGSMEKNKVAFGGVIWEEFAC